MRIVRGREPTPEADLDVTQSLVDWTRTRAETAVRVWRPHRIVAFGRRDTNRDGYESARRHATDRGYVPLERRVGGHAVAYTGQTVAFVKTEPIEDSRTGIQQRYESTLTAVEEALETLGVDPSRCEPEGAFCPGTHSLSANGKIAGLAQRVHRDVAVVSGVVVVSDHEEIAGVLEPIYAALDVPFRKASVGSVRRAGGQASAGIVIESLEETLRKA